MSGSRLFPSSPALDTTHSAPVSAYPPRARAGPMGLTFIREKSEIRRTGVDSFLPFGDITRGFVRHDMLYDSFYINISIDRYIRGN